MASKDVDLIQKIIGLLIKESPEPRLKEKILKISEGFAPFFIGLIPLYKKRANTINKEWKGLIGLFGSMREQDGSHSSSNESIEVEGNLKLSYRGSSACGHVEEVEECIAFMTDEQTLEKITYSITKTYGITNGKKEIITIKAVELSFEDNRLKKVTAKINLDNTPDNMAGSFYAIPAKRYFTCEEVF